MKRPMSWDEEVDVISSDDSSSSDIDADINGSGAKKSNSDIEVDDGSGAKNSIDNTTISEPSKEIISEDAVLRRAVMYQEYMKQVPIPTSRGSTIPFTSWVGLSKSIKQLYGQPLHYLTNILLRQWDLLRIGTEDEDQPLDTLIHPCKAEANIWLVEEVHRHTSSPHHIAKLWLADPMHHMFVDSIFPQLPKKI